MYNVYVAGTYHLFESGVYLLSHAENRKANIKMILELAIAFFKKKGVENTTAEDLSIASGLTQRSLFRYFGTMDQLVVHATAFFWSEIIRITNLLYGDIIESDKSGYEQLAEILSSMEDLFVQSKDSFMMLQEMEAFLYKKKLSFSDIYVNYVDKGEYESPIAKALRKGIEDGSLRPNLNVDEIHLIVYCIFTGVIPKLALCERDVLYSQRISPDSFISSTVRMMLEFVRAR